MTSKGVICSLCENIVDSLCKSDQHVFPRTLIKNLTKEQVGDSTAFTNVLLSENKVNDKNWRDIKKKKLTCQECEDMFSVDDTFLRELFVDRKHINTCKATIHNKKSFLSFQKGFQIKGKDLKHGEILKKEKLEKFKKAILGIIIRWELYRRSEKKTSLFEGDEFNYAKNIWTKDDYKKMVVVAAKYLSDKGNIVSPVCHEKDPLMIFIALDAYCFFVFFNNNLPDIDETKIPVLKKGVHSIVTKYQSEKIQKSLGK